MKHPLSKANVAADYPDYLRDESRKSGRADSLSFPTSADEVVALLAAAQAAGTAVTVQGGRTGITGGAVPEGGHILNLSRMRRVLGMAHDAARRRFTVTVEPGLPLADLRAMLRQGTFDTEGWTPESLAALKLFVESGGQFWPPDPTETSASIGGMAACNASGACSFRYGATRRHIDGIRVALADGSCLDLRRGRDRAVGRAFRVTTDRGRVIEGTLPAYTMPAVKNASGYFAEDDMDLVDLFVGAEGTLGVITRLDLVLQPEPPCRWGVTAFFPTEAAAIRFVKVVRRGTGPDSPVAVELFDEGALRLLRGQKAANPAFAAIPAMPESWNTAVYVEYHGAESSVSAAVELLPATMVAAGGTEDATWIAMTDAELERLKYFRHAVPEAVNLLIDERRRVAPGITKLGTDMAVPDAELDAVLAMYHADLAQTGLDHVIFGHIGNNHVHVNILPRTLQDHAAGKDLYLHWARRVIAMGGTVSAEHGIGKFKVALLREMFGEDGVHGMREVKRAFDPEGRLNRGNLF